MTYNFDPEKWRGNQLAAIQRRIATGELDPETAAAERAEIEQRYEDLIERLDGTYEIATRPAPRDRS